MSLDQRWRLKPEEERTNKDYYCAAQKEWSRAWDEDWDSRHPVKKGLSGEDESRKKDKRQVVRHIFLIRHGQYVLEDDVHGLTEMGRHQARKTGARLRQMADGLKRDHYGEQKIKWRSVKSSTMERAKETAGIIAQELNVTVEEEDPLLNEGNPCIMHPGQGYDLDSGKLVKLGVDPLRIECAFRKYIHRKDNGKKISSKEKVSEIFTGGDGGSGGSGDQVVAAKKRDQEVEHEYEVIVCHMNVIRYFVCRALQMPPEAWLRFRGDNCGLTEIIVYADGRVSLGRFADQGHLTIEETTFH